MAIVKSIKGEDVDFDFMRTKKKMEDRSKPKEVELRENYIDIKRRRKNPYRSVSELVSEQEKNANDVRERLRQQKLAKEAEELEATPEPEATATPRPSRRSSKGVVKRSAPTSTPEAPAEDADEE